MPRRAGRVPVKPRRRVRSEAELRAKLSETLGAIEDGIRAYRQGQASGWLLVCSQLFVLLCDRNSSNGYVPLAKRVFPDISFHPVMGGGAEPPRDCILRMPGGLMLSCDGQHPCFDSAKPRVALDDWLRQLFVLFQAADGSKVSFTIGDIIAAARHQEGPGHLDPSIDRLICETGEPVVHVSEYLAIVYRSREQTVAENTIPLPSEKPARPFYERAILAIADYIAGEVRAVMSGQDAGRPRNPSAGGLVDAVRLAGEVTAEAGSPQQACAPTVKASVLTDWAGAGFWTDPRHPAVCDGYALKGFSDLTSAESWPFGTRCPYYGTLVEVVAEDGVVGAIRNDPNHLIVAADADLEQAPDEDWLEALRVWFERRGMPSKETEALVMKLKGTKRRDIVQELVVVLRVPRRS